MRWPWRRHGRRRRAGAVLPPAVDQWATSWGDTFLPQPPLRSVAEPERLPVDTPSAASVRLGFSDGTEVDLQAGSHHAALLLAAADHLMAPPS
jgi:hypothetical protein